LDFEIEQFDDLDVFHEATKIDGNDAECTRVVSAACAENRGG
jgi:hypothetical protein